MKFNSDIDIDVADRERVLSLIPNIPAAMRNAAPMRKHPSGVHITEIPYDPVNKMAAIDYKDAESRGYLKLDLLNVHVYSLVKDETHLVELMREPNWEKLKNKLFVEKLIHIGNHYYSLAKMQEPVNSIPRLAMFLALIRPGKKHLIGNSWQEISKVIWDKGTDGYTFKKAHAIGYAWLVAIHMNLLEEQPIK